MLARGLLRLGYRVPALQGLTQPSCGATWLSTASGNPEKATRRRRRGGRSLDLSNDVPSYKEFMHRVTVVSMYRQYLKSIRNMPHSQADLKEQIQREFKANKGIQDPFNQQRAITDGKRRLAELQELTGTNKSSDGDSWLNTNDPQDPRGRVGQGWPWDR